MSHQSTDLGISQRLDDTQESMIQSGITTYCSISHEHGVRKGTGETGNAVLRQSICVKHTTSEDLGNRVCFATF